MNEHKKELNQINNKINSAPHQKQLYDENVNRRIDHQAHLEEQR
jgi:hypothetical protein